MIIYVALLCGINVGGKHSLPMQDLRDMLAALGCEDTKTYIQSGNAVFRSDDECGLLSSKIEAVVAEKFGFAPKVLLLTIDEYQSILAANPFPNAVDDPKSLHVSFLSETPINPDLDSLATLKSSTEKFKLLEYAFYLHAPDGIGRSKLAAKVEKCLGVQATGRNWRTASKLAELAASIIR
jgi:uncharacterized protein (DUF1697 family)